MTSLVVFNADDFGLDGDTTSETIRLLEGGILTSASIMPTASHAIQAMRYARSNNELSFGVHLTFAEDVDGRIASMRSRSNVGIGSGLVRRDGNFRPVQEIRRGAILNRLSPEAIKQEIRAQIAFVLDHGVLITHIDSHHHLHRHRIFRAALLEVLPEFNLKALRNAQDIYIGRSWCKPSRWLNPIWSRSIEGGFLTTNSFVMTTGSGGSVEIQDAVMKILRSETIEVACHPGTVDPDRRSEVEQAVKLRAALLHAGALQIGWREMLTVLDQRARG